MTYLFIIVCLAAAFAHGLHEGMVMIQNSDVTHTGEPDGVRGHIWFRWYHVISGVLRNGLFVLCGAMLAYSGVIATIKIVPGLIFGCWQLAENGYAFGRGGRLLYKSRGVWYEHVYFGVWDAKITGDAVIALHFGRVLSAVSGLMMGVFL